MDLVNSLKNILLVCTLVGMLGIVAFGAREAETLVGRIGGGIYSLYGITSYIGDFVSYLRLMALGLAGGFIAVAINIIVKNASKWRNTWNYTWSNCICIWTII